MIKKNKLKMNYYYYYYYYYYVSWKDSWCGSSVFVPVPRVSFLHIFFCPVCYIFAFRYWGVKIHNISIEHMKKKKECALRRSFSFQPVGDVCVCQCLIPTICLHSDGLWAYSFGLFFSSSYIKFTCRDIFILFLIDTDYLASFFG